MWPNCVTWMTRCVFALSFAPFISVNFFAARTGSDFAATRAAEPSAAPTGPTVPELPAAVISTPPGAEATGPTGAIGRKAAGFLTLNERGALQPCLVQWIETFDPFGACTTSFETVAPLRAVFQLKTTSDLTAGGLR